MTEPTLPLTFDAILAQIMAPTTIIEPWPGFRADIAEHEHEQMMAAIRSDLLYGSPIALDEAACLRLSIADSYKPHSPVWCPSVIMEPYFPPSERVIDKMWYDVTHGWPAPSFHVRSVMLGGMRRDDAMQDWRKWYFYGKLKRRTGWRDDRRRYRRRTAWRTL